MSQKDEWVEVVAGGGSRSAEYTPASTWLPEVSGLCDGW